MLSACFWSHSNSTVFLGLKLCCFHSIPLPLFNEVFRVVLCSPSERERCLPAPARPGLIATVEEFLGVISTLIGGFSPPLRLGGLPLLLGGWSSSPPVITESWYGLWSACKDTSPLLCWYWNEQCTVYNAVDVIPGSGRMWTLYCRQWWNSPGLFQEISHNHFNHSFQGTTTFLCKWHHHCCQHMCRHAVQPH